MDPAVIEAYADAGVDGISLDVTWNADLGTVKRELDQHASFRERYVPT